MRLRTTGEVDKLYIGNLQGMCFPWIYIPSCDNATVYGVMV